MNDKKPWTDDLRDKLSQYEAKNVPQGLWDDIAKSLDAKKGRVLPWRKIACAAAVVAALFGVGILWNANDVTGNKEQPVVAEMQKEPITPITTTEERVDESFVQHVAMSNRVASAAVLAIRKEYEDFVQEEKSQPITNAEHENADSKVSDTEATKSIVVKESGNGKSMLAENKVQSAVKGKERRSANRGISMTLYASNLSLSSVSLGNMQSVQNMVYMDYAPIAPSMSPTINPLRAVAYSNRNETTKTDVKHHRPMSIGVGARYFFNSHWAIESGISYLMLESETKSGSDHSYTYTDEKVRYIGVPVAVGYQWLDTKRISVYSSVGVQANFGISGKQECQYVVDEQPIGGTTTTDIDDIPLQWSLTAAAGLQYNIMKNFGIYAEPGVAYYIDNGSSLQTSYSDKKLPLVFNLRIGLRYDLGK